jgi:hypothetical protein
MDIKHFAVFIQYKNEWAFNTTQRFFTVVGCTDNQSLYLKARSVERRLTWHQKFRLQILENTLSLF